MELGPEQLAFARHIDGHRTIREIAECAAQESDAPETDAGELGKLGRQLLQSLWLLDLVAMALADK